MSGLPTAQIALPHLYVIAGEHSGDQLGGSLLSELKTITNFKLSGLGAQHMQAQGLQSLFPIEDIAVIGIAEIIPHIFRLKKRIRMVAEDIERKKPDMVVSIDSPGFTFRVIELLRNKGYKDSIFVHYVAQTVWAYRPRRAAKAARLLDALMTLFEFEAPYFTPYGLKTQWVGHQAAWTAKSKHERHIIKHQIAMFPGSRRNELKRHIPLFREVCEQLLPLCPDMHISMPVPDDLQDIVASMTSDWPCRLTFARAVDRESVLASSQIALCKSGTISLECALSGTPMVITYKANPISAWVVRRTLQTAFVGLPNILAGKAIVPEFIQEHAKSEAIANALYTLLSNKEAYQEQQHALSALKHTLLPSATQSPSRNAAEFVASMLTPC